MPDTDKYTSISPTVCADFPENIHKRFELHRVKSLVVFEFH